LVTAEYIIYDDIHVFLDYEMLVSCWWMAVADRLVVVGGREQSESILQNPVGHKK
jgi:hypothetical protein